MKLLVFSLLTLLAATCGGGNASNRNTNAEPSADVYAAVSKTESALPTTINEPANRKMIWRGNVEIKVGNVSETTEKINELCSKYGAFVSGMDMNNTNYEISNNITIRVESKHFSQLIEDIKAEADYVNNVSVSSNDVTEEYIDIQSRSLVGT